MLDQLSEACFYDDCGSCALCMCECHNEYGPDATSRWVGPADFDDDTDSAGAAFPRRRPIGPDA